MNNETQRRINAYKAALPALRERVIAVALLLAMSASMLTSASFAWLTISRNPEVSGVSTTVAANGNLEIALVAPDGSEPGESAVGDSSAAEGQGVAAANLTWGNLINLSDPSYGLDNLILRPAQLNTAALKTSPLFGAVYLQDGRIEQLTSNFAYTIWNPPEGDKPGYFGVSENNGVRAISSTKIEAVGAEAYYVKLVNDAKNANLAAASAYVNLGNNDKYMPSLATMMGLYMTARMNPSEPSLNNPDCAKADIENLRDMYAGFLEAFDAEADAIAKLLNLQLFLKVGEGNYTPYTAEAVYATTDEALAAAGLKVTRLNEFKKDRSIIASDLEKLKTICNSGSSLKWQDSGMNTIVNNLVNVGACTIGADNTPISSIGASNAMGYLSGTQEARITNGILYRFEERTGGYIEVKDLSISATVKRSGITVPATVKANIKTTASRDYNLFGNDMAYTESLNSGEFQGGIPVAQDTYGLAVDLWVRTNAPDSYLVLEGNVVTQTRIERATGVDAEGNTVELFVWNRSITDDEGNTVNVDTDLYQKVGTNDAVTWYNAVDHTIIPEEELGDTVPNAKTVEVEYILGYEGENRVWGENDQLSTDATTQGSGSCYVYYADTPEDQARSLKLLESFNVAFVDEDGRLIASAIMDTTRYFAENGRVIVPLVLNPSNSINLGEDYQGNITYAITELPQNKATRITAIVYLDGTKLTNQDVLAASDIQGQLNIQFGSSATLNALTNEELELQECRVTASVEPTNFDYMTATGPMTSTVTLTVDGAEPKTVTAFFLRSVSSTQGSREEVMTFTKIGGSQWTADYTFKMPGKYVLRSVQLDGVDYDLSMPADELPTVNITGFTLEYLNYGSNVSTGENANHISVMTAAGSTSADLSLKFAMDAENTDKQPKSVRGRFIREEDGSVVNVDFHMGSNHIWSGTANFLSSGHYTMQYLVLDEEYMELDPAMWKTANITLGMKVAVYTTSPNTFKYVPSEMTDNMKLLGMQVMVMDNTGTEMPGLSDVKLTYGMKGSGIKKMDTDLTWNGSYYVGELTTTGPGIWQFSNVTVGSNVLTTATNAPAFTIQSPEPPEYYAHGTVAYQYKPSNNAEMNAQITNSAAATVQAYIIKDGAAEGTWVDGTIGGEFTADGKPANHWNFKVPTDANGYQDGNWKLTQLKLWDVFAEDGTPYTQDEPMILDMTDTNNVTKVVSRVVATFTENQSQNLTGNNFMVPYSVKGLHVDIADVTGAALVNDEKAMVTDVKLTFQYSTGSNSYGGYTSASLNNATEGATITVNLVDDGSHKHFVQADDAPAKFLYAGQYATILSYKVNGAIYTFAGNKDNATENIKALPANAPVMTVSSEKPTVTITSVSTNPTTARMYTTTKPINLDVITGSYNKKIDDYNAVVYMYVAAQTGSLDQEQVKIKYPTVTLGLSGVPANHEGAELIVANAANNSFNKTFSFAAGSTTATSDIGGGADGVFNEGLLGIGAGVEKWPVFYPAGRQSVDQITINYGGLSYVVKLSHTVIIDQQQTPAVLRFVGIPETYLGEKPANVTGTGGTIEVTLPELSWTARIEEPQNGTWSAYTAVNEVTDESGKPVGRVYSYRTWTEAGQCEDTTYEQWQYYRWMRFQSSITAQTDIYTQAKKISKWTINGKTYNAGETVTLTGEGVISATAVVVNTGEKTYVETLEQTTTKNLYGYVKDSSIKESSDGGTMIGDKLTNKNAAFITVDLANTSTANAATDTPGTNMTTDSTQYDQYWP